jgi:replication factor C subunit 2/4
MSKLWVEKYRPTTINSIVSQNDILSSFKNILILKNMPHLLFFGPSGCGKTSTILSLARDLFGKYFKERVIELNASDERGIKVVREKIKIYAKTAINHKDNIPPWKIIILDEADSMTVDSQFALRKIMEDFSDITRFCIICNYHHKIIDPIVSRCTMYRFKPITKVNIKKTILSICNKENLICNNTTLNLIIDISRGDLRKGINLLQKCKNTLNNNITNNIVNDILGKLDSSLLKKLIHLSIKKEEKLVLKVINYCLNNSYSLLNQLKHLSELILKNKIFTDSQKSHIILKIVDIDQSLINGCNETIQYYRLFYYIMSI